MKARAMMLAAALLTAGALRAQTAPTVAATQLKVGEAAPDFTLLSDQWQPVHLGDYRGKKNVILAFYVLAFTPG